jgi:hypothetical protein
MRKAPKKEPRHSEKTYTIKAEASQKEATTGRIIISGKDFHKSIPAVVFTPDKANKLLDMVEATEK